MTGTNGAACATVATPAYTVRQGERLDNITARMLGDPLQFWRIADANNAMRPNELTEAIGRQLRITLPAGVAGPVL